MRIASAKSLAAGAGSPLDPRQRIVAEARRHFMAHGFRGTTMDDLSRELGMSKKTLYAHFTTKTQLVEAVVQAKFAELDAELQRVANHDGENVAKALHDLIATVQLHAAEVQPAFVRDIQREAPEIFNLVQTRRKAIIQQHFGRLLAEGRKAGLVRRDVRVPLMIEILLGAVQSIVNPTKLTELKLEPKSAIGCILKVLLDGALTREGKAAI